MAVKRARPRTQQGSSAAVARSVTDIWRLLRTFSTNQLAGPAGQSECPDPNEAPPKEAPQTWLEQHIENMTDDLADLIAARLGGPAAPPGGASMLLTKAQVAAELQCSTRTVDRWCEEGLLPEPLHFGGTPRWLRSDLEEWFKNREWQQ